MDTTASLTRSNTRVSERHATNSVLVDLVAHLVIAFAIGLAASLALAGAVLLLSDNPAGPSSGTPSSGSYAVPANQPSFIPANPASS